MEIIQSNELIWWSFTFIFQPSTNEMLSAFSSKTNLLIQNNYNYCHKDSQMSCTFSPEICIGNRGCGLICETIWKRSPTFLRIDFFLYQSFIIWTMGHLQLSYHVVQRSPYWRAKDALTGTCFSKKIQIWRLSFTCPSASFVLQYGDFVPRDCSKGYQRPIAWQLSHEYPEQQALKILWKTVHWTKKYLSTNSKIASVILYAIVGGRGLHSTKELRVWSIFHFSVDEFTFDESL